jgi:hypothetical protein
MGESKPKSKPVGGDLIGKIDILASSPGVDRLAATIVSPGASRQHARRMV